MAEERKGRPFTEPEDDGLVRHYSRERRLSRASPEVRWLVKQYDAKRPGLLGSLVATRSLRFMFFSLILFAVAGGLLSFLTGRQDSGTLGGHLFKISAFRFGETVYITVRRTARAGTPFSGNARMTYRVDEGEDASLEIPVSPSGQEEYRMTTVSAGKGGHLSLVIEAGGAFLELTSPIR